MMKMFLFTHNPRLFVLHSFCHVDILNLRHALVMRAYIYKYMRQFRHQLFLGLFTILKTPFDFTVENEGEVLRVKSNGDFKV